MARFLNRRSFVRSSVSLVLLLIAGCAAPVERAPDSREGKGEISPRELNGSRWVLVEMSDERVSRDPQITLEIEEGSAGGYSGCNWYGGEVVITDEEFRMGESMGTARACADRALNEREKRYQRTLSTVRSWRVEEGKLILSGDAVGDLLVYEPITRLEMSPEDLVGTQWRIEPGSEYGDDVRLAFESESEISGFAGCRGFDAGYVAEKDEIDIERISMKSMTCDDDALLQTEGLFTTDLSETERWKLEGDRLELYTSPGRTIELVRAD